MSSVQAPRYSLVIPLFNEEDVLSQLFAALDALMGEMDGTAEVIMIDDGSSDATAKIASEQCRCDGRYRLIRLSRNFGHQVAITAGLDRARGDAVVVMDADLQDPPAVALSMIEKWKEGFDIVYAQRTVRQGESHFKRLTARAFYRFVSKIASVDIPADTGDFRLVDRAVLRSFGQMHERDRFVRGMFAWMGFKQTAIQFQRPPRAAGTTKYSVRKMAGLALNGIVGFSDAPLRLALWTGATVSLLAMCYGLYVIAIWLRHASLVPGWSSTIVITAFLSGMNMLMTGMLGVYVGRIHNEVKGRPLYFVRGTEGFEEAQPEQTSFEPLARLREHFPISRNGTDARYR